MKQDVKDITRLALLGDAEAIRELRRLGVLNGKTAENRYAASHAQKSLWLWQQRNPDGSAYSMPFFIPLSGAIPVDACEKAVRLLFKRHDSFRTVFELHEGKLFQCVQPPAPVRLEVEDLRTGSDRREAMLRAVGQDLDRPFDLAHGPLIRFRLFVIGDDRRILYVNGHHIILDGFSQAVLTREITFLCESFAEGKDPVLPAPTLQMKDHAAWQARLLESERGRAMLEWWRRQMEGFEPVELPLDFPRPKSGAGTGKTLSVPLDPQANAALRHFAQEAGCTFFNVLAFCTAALLARYTGSRDVTIGMPCACRTRGETESLVGLLANPVALRFFVDSEKTFAENLAAAKTTTLEAMERQDYPFELLVEKLEPPLHPGRNPFFDVVVAAAHSMGEKRDEFLPGPDELTLGHTKFDLLVTFEDGPDGAGLTMEYNADLFLPGRMERMAAHLSNLLSVAASSPHMALGRIDILSPEERRRVTVDFNDTRSPYPDKDLAELFEDVAARYPERPAVAGPHFAPVTYAELDRRADQVADALRGTLDVTPGSFIGVVPSPRPDLIVLLLGILKAGCAYMPIDLSLPRARIAFLLERSACPLVLAAGHEGKRAFQAAAPGTNVLAPDDLSVSPPKRKKERGRPEGPCYLMFTSGSTGEPKGVSIPHRGVARLVLNTNYFRFTPEDRVLQAGPLAFDASTFEIWGPLLSGGCVCLAEKEALLESGGLSRIITELGVTVLWLTAGLCHRMAEDGPETFRPLRALLAGGDVLNPGLMRRILECCPDIQLINGYGPTENTTFTTTHRIAMEDTRGPIPIGRPIANTRVYILDDNGLPLPVGVWGEIRAAGDGLALEYVGRPDLTETAFVESPALPGERLYRTGDVGRWRTDGIIEFMGRRDSQVKIRGFRIEIEEIEDGLLRAPGVRQAAVVVTGENGDKELAAFVAADSGDPDIWRRFLEGVLPPYMIPASFTALPEIPLTPNGKADRRLLAAMAPEACAVSVEVDPPRGETERGVAALFEEVLGRPVGRSDDFFRLGGHSLKAMQVLNRIHKRFKVSLALRDFFSSPTVQATARLIRTDSKDVSLQIPRADEAPDYPVSHGQRRLWVLSRMEGGNRAYTIVGAMKLSGEPDFDTLRAALGKLSERHEILRTTFHLAGDEIRQKIHASLPPLVDRKDVSGEADPLSRIFELVRNEAGRSFDLEHGPLWRLLLVRTGPAEHVLLSAMHHIVSDGWSMDVISRELEALYDGSMHGREAALPALPFHYRDFAVWRNGQPADTDNHMDWWVKHLSGAAPQPDLPADRQRPRTQSFEGAVLRFTLPGTIGDRLKRFVSGGHGHFAVLTALVKTLLHRYTGAEDILVGCPVAGREQSCLEDQVGLYVNTVVLRDSLRPDMAFRTLAENVAQTISRAVEHQSAPFDLLVEKLGLPRDVSRAPLFNVMVSLQNPDRALPSFSGLRAEPFDIDTGTSQFDLTFDFQNIGGTLHVTLEYNTDIFDRARMERLRDHLLTLASSAVSAPDTVIGRLMLLPETERMQVLTWGNEHSSSAVEPDFFDDPVSRFETLAGADPHAPALVFQETRLTRGEVNRLANGLAHTLIQRGLKPGEPVALLLPRSEKAAWGALGIAKAGGAFLNLDSDHPEARIEDVLRQAEVRLVVTEAERAQSLSRLLAGRDLIDAESVAQTDCADPLVARRAEDLAYIVFTSGSTGTPKGVLMERGPLANLMRQADQYMYGGLGSGLREAMSSPYIFDVSVQQVFAALSRGHVLHVLPNDARHDPARFLGYLEREKVGVADTTPGFLAEILEELGSGGFPHTLKRLSVGNEALPRTLVERFYASPARAEVSLVNVYGPTECCVNAVAEPLHPGSIAPGLTAPIGRPLPGVRVLILDKDDKPAPVSVPGEIVLSGAGLARGYLNQPQLTAERFVPHPFRPGERIYRTGDLGRFLEDGRIEFLGRVDEQFKVRGFRIEAGEIKHRLQQHPSVRTAVVDLVTVRDETPELVAWIEPVEAEDIPSSKELRAHLASTLPGYMIPAFIVPVPRFALLAGGKADKRALLRDYPPAAGRASHEAVPSAPPDEAEAQVLDIWRTVLRTDQVDREANFFEAGGNSLLIIRLHRELQKRFPDVFTVTDLFALPTVADQARRIAAQKAPVPAAAPAVRLHPSSSSGPVAIIGMAVRLADYDDPDGLWTDLVHGVDRVRPFPEARKRDAEGLLKALGWDAGDNDFREMAFLDRVDLFDPGFFRLSPADGALLTPSQRLFVETAWRAVEDAGYGGRRLKGAKVGVFGGGTAQDQEFINAAQMAMPQATEQIFANNTPSNTVTRLGYLMDWHGPAMMVDTACSSGLAAVHMAIRSMYAGECDFVLAGAARTVLLPLDRGGRLRVESTDGRTRAFSDGSDGTGSGEGCIVFLLKPLERAMEEGDRIHAVIRGSALNQDGNSAGLTVPNPKAQAALITEAWNNAGLNPSSMGYLEAHGTGTSLGDPIEIEAVTKAVRPFTSRRQFIPVGSVKTNFGHLDNAAGLLGLAKAVLCLDREAIPPSINFEAPNRAIRFEDSPLYVCDRLTPWPRSSEPRRCGVSGFGLSGINCHVVLEEAPERKSSSHPNARIEPGTNKPGSVRTEETVHGEVSNHERLGKQSTGTDQSGPHLLPLATPNDEGLVTQVRAYLLRLAMEPDLENHLDDLCFTASVGRGHNGHRLAFVFDSLRELRSMLEQVAEEGPGRAAGGSIHYGASSRKGSDGPIEPPVPENPKDRPSLEALADHYVQGADILWETLYRGQDRRPITVPGSIMNPRRLWPRLDAVQKRHAGSRTLPGPILDRLLAETPDRTIYGADLDPDRCWPLGEHRVSGTNVLVGTAYLQMGFEASVRSGGKLPLEVRDLFLQSLLAPEPDTEVVVEVEKRDHTQALSVSSRENGKEARPWSKHAQALLAPSEAVRPRIDLEDLRGRLNPVSEGTEERSGNDGLVRAGERWDCLRGLWSGDGEWLGLLELPLAYKDDLDTYDFHPAMLDVALHFALALLKDSRNLMPMSMARANLFAPIPAVVYSHARLLSTATDSSARFDITICDADGTVVADIREYTLSRFKGAARRPRLLAPEWAPVTTPPPEVDGPRRVALILASGQEETEPARGLIECLSAQGGPTLAGIVTMGEDLTESRAEEVVGELLRMEPDAIVFLPPACAETPAENFADLEKRLLTGIEACFLLVKGLANRAGGAERTLLLVGRGGFAAGGASVTRPENTALAALAKTICLEYDHLRCRYIDLDTGSEAAAIIEELRWASVEPTFPVALRGSTRHAEKLAPVEEASPALSFPIQNDDVVVVSGGLGGIGLALCNRLASLARFRFALIGRNPLPDRKTWNDIPADSVLARRVLGIRALEEAGSEIMDIAADVADPDSLAGALESVRQRWGRIDAVVHCAGEAGDGFLFRKDLSEFRRVIRPKIQGTWLLDKQTRRDRPSLFFLCSSLTGFTGGPGQGDYAAANAFQDGWAQLRAAQDAPALSLAWCAWAETGMAFDRNVVDPERSLTTDEALDVFERAVSRPEPRLLVEEPGPEPENAKGSTDHQATRDVPSGVVLTGRPDGIYSETERIVASIWAKILGHETLAVDEDFFRLGGDSINAMRIRNEAVTVFGPVVSIADLFSHPTIEKYAALVDSKRGDANPDPDTCKSASSAIARASDRPWYPLSMPQRWMYRLWENAPQARGWNLPEAWEIRGALDVDRLESALGRLLNRHEILRARFRKEATGVVQSFESFEDFRLPVRTIPPDEIENEVTGFVRPFDLLNDRLFRAELLRVGPDRHILWFDMHHIVSDGLSLDIFGREMTALYLGSVLPELQVRYRDYAVWQDERLTNGILEPHLEYWLNRFRDGVPRLDLPTDFARSPLRKGNGGLVHVTAEGPVLEGVQRLARETGTTLFAVFLSAVFTLLHRLTDREDMVVEVSDHGRTVPETQDGFGMFVGALPLRAKIDAAWSAPELVRTIRSRLMEGMAHREVPVYRLAERLESQPPRERSRLADVVVSYMNFGDSTEEAQKEWSMTPLPIYIRRSTVADLKFFVTERRCSMEVLMEYDADLFHSATAAGFADRLIQVLREMGTVPEMRVGSAGRRT